MDFHSDAKSLKFALDLANALRHLHSNDPCIVHGDIRCANVLINSKSEAILADWGLAKCLDCPQSTYRMSRGCHLPWPWSAPEVILDREYSTCSDIYMFGVTIWEVLTEGDSPYDYQNLNLEVNMKQFAKQIRKGERKLSFPAKSNRDLVKVLISCLDAVPKNRPSASTLCTLLEAIDLPKKVIQEQISLKNVTDATQIKAARGGNTKTLSGNQTSSSCWCFCSS
mmetsp:Transcript_31205/g.50265  ORF Transcript_31205/g.50265 Transcript_31205/m.50265 type:complete len:225 (-) Transcript_31205:552-1226(-)